MCPMGDTHCKKIIIITDELLRDLTYEALEIWGNIKNKQWKLHLWMPVIPLKQHTHHCNWMRFLFRVYVADET